VSTQAVDRAEAGLSWREQGLGQPVLFLHGLGGTRRSWGPQLAALSDRFRCIAWDMPGYGNAAAVEPLTFRAIADHVVALLDHLDIDQVDVVGLSFGGMHALHTAIHYPGRIRRMVLADTSPAFGIDGTDKAEWMASRLAALDAGETPAVVAARVIDAITAVTLTGELRDEIVGAFRDISPAGYRAAVQCLPTNDVRANLAAIAQPCRVIVGELDDETPVSNAQLLVDGLPNAELHILDGVGHLTPSEDPDRFNELTAQFLLAP